MNAELLTSPETERVQQEQCVKISGLDWQQYLAIDAALQDAGVRLTYLDGDLEIVSPISRLHESRKSWLGALVGAYCDEKRIPHNQYGSTSLTEEEKNSGGEPDESFVFGEDKETPDLVIEVIIASGSINKLERYQRFGVPEVWFWKKDTLSIYSLGDQGYVKSERSVLLPGLDIALLSRCAVLPMMSDAKQVFRETMRRDSEGK